MFETGALLSDTTHTSRDDAVSAQCSASADDRLTCPRIFGP
jgi:hypothetical protein